MSSILCLDTFEFVMYGVEDPTIAGMFLDSPFSDLVDLMMELIETCKIRLPKFMMMVALIRPTCFTTITEGQRRRRQGSRETSELVTVFFLCSSLFMRDVHGLLHVYVYFLFPVGWPEAFVGFLCVLVVVDGLRLILVVSYYAGCAWK
ncbi:hypothetical protein Dimus_022758 [Dionaea muscipula]